MQDKNNQTSNNKDDQETKTECCQEEGAENKDFQEHSDQEPFCQEVEILKQENKALKEKVLLARADADNMRRSCMKQVEDAVRYGSSDLARDILTFVDNLERASQCSPKGELSDEVKSFIQGIQLIVNDILASLEKHGIKKVSGDVFNPDHHQAVSQVESEGKASGTILQTLQTGYTLNGRLLRPAMVVVAK